MKKGYRIDILKLTTFGNSIGLILDKAWIKESNLKKGDRILVKMEPLKDKDVVLKRGKHKH